jgi:hypothetical protein
LRRRTVRDADHPAKAIRDAVIGENPHRDDIAILTIHIGRVDSSGVVHQSI